MILYWRRKPSAEKIIEIQAADVFIIKPMVSGGFAEVNPEKCIVLAESVDEINSIEKSLIEKEIQKLEEQDTDISKEQLNIAKAKIDALDSNYYEKI